MVVDQREQEPIPRGDALLALALSRPAEAERVARSLLADDPDPATASFAHQALGIVVRDRGDTTEATRAFRAAVRCARSTGHAAREADCTASLATALALAGRTGEAIRTFDAAVAGSRGALRGRILVRRGAILLTLGRITDAREDLARATQILARAGDRLWEARARQNRALAHLASGRAGPAEHDLVRAESLFDAVGQDLEQTFARHNRGLVAAARGDLPTALKRLHEAQDGYRRLRATVFDLPIDLCATLLAAGLADEAANIANGAVDVARSTRGNATVVAELLVAAAEADDAAGRQERAHGHAVEAGRLLRRQRRQPWVDRADAIALRTSAPEDVSPGGLRQACALARRLDESGSSAATAAFLGAARLAVALGRTGVARAQFAQAARARRASTPLVRSLGWLGCARTRLIDGRFPSALAACDHGLAAVETHLQTLGATELRAYATTHGNELATLAVREMVRRDDAWGALQWIERWRAVAAAVTAPLPVDDPDLARDLTALRRIAGQVETLVLAGEVVPTPLERERSRLERSVRDRSRTLRGDGTRPGGADESSAIVAALGDRALVELAAVDGELIAVTVVDGHARLHVVGAMADAADECRRASFSLRRAATGRRSAGRVDLLAMAGTSMQTRVLGVEIVDRLGDRPVLVVPPAGLAAVPWALLPGLWDRAVAVAHSATAWRAAALRRRPATGAPRLVTGPGLASGGREVEALGTVHPNAVRVDDAAATVERVLATLDRAPLAHVAAHGVFRADNPLFSSLRLVDGPLMAHDLRRLTTPPHRLILSSCDSGASAAAGADGVLGFGAVLLGMGTSGLVCATTLVNDDATVDYSLALHRALASGRTIDQAALAGRRAMGDDPVGRATGAAFVALGA